MLTAVWRPYVDGDDKRVQFNLAPYIDDNEVPMFTGRDLQCTVSGGKYKSGASYNKPLIRVKFNRLCDQLLTVDKTSMIMGHCSEHATAISATANPVKQECLKSMISRFRAATSGTCSIESIHNSVCDLAQ